MFKNDIEIIGILSQEDIDRLDYDDSLISSDNNYIFINKKNYSINNLIKIAIALEPTNDNAIYMKDKTIISIEGIKIYNIEYRNQKHKKVSYSASSPFSITFETPLNNFELDDYDIHIINGLYKTVSNRIIFENLTYMITLSNRISNNAPYSEPIHKPLEETKAYKEITKNAPKELIKIAPTDDNELLKNVDLFEEFL